MYNRLSVDAVSGNFPLYAADPPAVLPKLMERLAVLECSLSRSDWLASRGSNRRGRDGGFGGGLSKGDVAPRTPKNVAPAESLLGPDLPYSSQYAH